MKTSTTQNCIICMELCTLEIAHLHHICDGCRKLQTLPNINGVIVLPAIQYPAEHAWTLTLERGWMPTPAAARWISHLYWVGQHGYAVTYVPTTFEGNETDWAYRLTINGVETVLTPNLIGLNHYLDFIAYWQAAMRGLPTAHAAIPGTEHKPFCPFDEIQKVYACTCRKTHQWWCGSNYQVDCDC